MKAISFQDDIIIAAGEGAVPGIEMPAGVPRGRLRYDGNALIDIEAVGQFFIDELGTKHILQTDPAWQLLVCAWDEELTLDGGVWRVRQPADDLAAQKDRGLRLLADLAERARQRYITPGDGKAAIYAVKHEEALAWQAIVDAAGTPVLDDFPWIKARAERIGIGGQAVADEWNAKATAWMAAGRDIENAYESAAESIQALDDAATARADVDLILTTVIWP